MNILDPDAAGFSPGAIASPDDERDYQWSEIGANAALFDWDTGYDVEQELGYKLAPKDQGASSSCGGQAWSMYAAVLEALATSSFEERSAKYIYAQTCVAGGGSAGRSNADSKRSRFRLHRSRRASRS